MTKLKFTLEYKCLRRAKMFLKKKDKMEILALVNVKTNYKAVINMTIWLGHKNRELGKWYRIKSSDTNTYMWTLRCIIAE